VRVGAFDHFGHQLTEAEVEALIAACKDNRQPHRDATMILIAFRHGLRASELVDLQWTQVDFEAARLAVSRVKNGTPSTHPLTARELRALRKLRRDAKSLGWDFFERLQLDYLQPQHQVRRAQRSCARQSVRSSPGSTARRSTSGPQAYERPQTPVHRL
jgi:integrase